MNLMAELGGDHAIRTGKLEAIARILNHDHFPTQIRCHPGARRDAHVRRQAENDQCVGPKVEKRLLKVGADKGRVCIFADHALLALRF